MKCNAPMMIKNPAFNDQKTANKLAGIEDRVIPVRCGKCEGCLKSTINQWAFRLEQEARRSLYVHFVTLTYTPEFVPLSNTLLPTLDKKDVQKWFKRLRKIEGKGVKYFIVGEYGTNTYRPHYHAIIFNVSSTESYHKSWRRDGKPLGNIHIGNDISSGAIPYTLKYMYKKGLVPAFDGDDRLKEFRLMSKKLGINYLSDNIKKYHLMDWENRQFVRNKDGFKIGMPRYFRKKFTEEYPEIATTKIENETFMVDDDPNLSLKGRIKAKKARQKEFERKRNQEKRKKI